MRDSQQNAVQNSQKSLKKLPAIQMARAGLHKTKGMKVMREEGRLYTGGEVGRSRRYKEDMEVRAKKSSEYLADRRKVSPVRREVRLQ